MGGSEAGTENRSPLGKAPPRMWCHCVGGRMCTATSSPSTALFCAGPCYMALMSSCSTQHPSDTHPACRTMNSILTTLLILCSA